MFINIKIVCSIYWLGVFSLTSQKQTYFQIYQHENNKDHLENMTGTKISIYSKTITNEHSCEVSGFFPQRNEL